jgi:hypothetical protein
MVITRLAGGLGNQMFQYAAARRLAHVLQTTLKLDLSYYDRQDLRAYRLHSLQVQATIATPKEIVEIRGKANHLAGKVISRLRQELNLVPGWTIIREPHMRPRNERVMTATGNVYLDGYWQSEQYFKEIEAIIRAEFALKQPVQRRSQEVARKIEAGDAVSIHIRRGDYVSNPETKRLHGTCSLHYYRQAAAMLEPRLAKPHFFIFSDEPDWAEANLKLGQPMTFVRHNGPDQDYEDLWLMSLCRHHIIANSSFSWWGAWLSRNPKRVVFAPRNWFRRRGRNTRDLLPEDWLAI